MRNKVNRLQALAEMYYFFYYVGSQISISSISCEGIEKQ